MMDSISLVLLVQSRFLNLFLIIDHRFSIGFRSGEFPGHSKVVMLFSVMYLVTFFEVWQGAKSCWKIQSLLGKIFVISGTSLCCRTLIYLSEFIIPSTGCSVPGPWTVKQPQNIFLSGCFTCCSTCPARTGSPMDLRYLPTRLSSLSHLEESD